MKFEEKIKQLRKAKGITQEQLAKDLFVSRTAVSKWESGRGYPSIDCLKTISKYFDVSLDELLSTDETLFIAEQNSKNKTHSLSSLVNSFLDISVLLLFFLPFFGYKVGEEIFEVSLLNLANTPLYLVIPYYVVVICIIVLGLSNLVVSRFDVKACPK